MLQIIEDQDPWNKAISIFPSSDIYHSWDYHQITKKAGEKPVLIFYKESDRHIALPLLKRSIPGTVYSDLTSVYGYAGPLSLNLDANFDNTIFKNELFDFFRENQMVSIFSRLNPFIPFQEVVLKGIGEYNILGPMVNIDLTSDLELQRQRYSKTTKRYVNRLGRLCKVVKSSKQEDINTFMDLYYETMNRVDAKAGYFFDKEYFYKLISNENLNTELLFAQLEDSGEMICGALMFKNKDIVQYHLSGTRSDYLNLTPLRLLIDHTRIRANEEGYKFFNLGGGLGSNEDSLFYFKSSFSKDYKDFAVWRLVADKIVYQDLINQKRREASNITSFEKSKFFPLYRVADA